MIYVTKQSDREFAVQFKPINENLERIKSLKGATFDGEKRWQVPIDQLYAFESAFAGEFIYLTPRHELTGDPPPPLPGMYKKIPRHPINRIKPPFTLYDYQSFGANFIALMSSGAGHAFLTDSVGTGKTLMSIAGAHILQDQGKADTAIIFCKASLKYQWLRDGIHKFTHDEGIVIDGTKKQRAKQYAEAVDKRYRYVIVNYELLLHDFSELTSLVKAKDIRLGIMDEAHKVTNPKGKQNNALAKLVQEDKKKKYPGIEHIFYLTATPLSSKIEQMYGLFSIRRPDIFGKFSEFSKRHLKHAFNGRTAELVGYKGLDEIKQKTWKYMLRRTSNEIDMELPDRIDIHKDVTLTPLQKKLDMIAQEELEKVSITLKFPDEKLSEEQRESLEGVAKSMFYVRKAICDDPQLLALSRSNNIQKTFGSIIASSPDADKSPKWDELKDLIEELVVDNGEKLIVFSELETMVRLLETKINKMGIKCVKYTGKMNSREKDAAVMAFKDDPDTMIFLATDAGAEGLNLQNAGYLVNYDLPWNPDVLTQRNGRIQRGGSTYKTVKIFNLLAQEGIDKAVYEAIVNKQNLFNYFVENTAEQSEALKEAMYG